MKGQNDRVGFFEFTSVKENSKFPDLKFFNLKKFTAKK